MAGLIRAPRAGDVLYLGSQSEAFSYLGHTVRRLDGAGLDSWSRWLVLDTSGEEFAAEHFEARDALLRMAVHDNGERLAWVVADR